MISIHTPIEMLVAMLKSTAPHNIHIKQKFAYGCSWSLEEFPHGYHNRLSPLPKTSYLGGPCIPAIHTQYSLFVTRITKPQKTTLYGNTHSWQLKSASATSTLWLFYWVEWPCITFYRPSRLIHTRYNILKHTQYIDDDKKY